MKFLEDSQNSIFIALDFDGVEPTDNVTLSAMYDLIRDIEKLDNVKSISGIALPDSAMNKSSVLGFLEYS